MLIASSASNYESQHRKREGVPSSTGFLRHICEKFNTRAKEMDVPLCRLTLWLDPRYRAAVPCNDVEFKELGREVRACICFALAPSHCKHAYNTVTHELRHRLVVTCHSRDKDAHHEGPRLQ
jgi:hypothetical protein